MLRSDGSPLWVAITMSVPMRKTLGATTTTYERAIAVVEDITERMRLESELHERNAEPHRLSCTDALTGLGNR